MSDDATPPGDVKRPDADYAVRVADLLTARRPPAVQAVPYNGEILYVRELRAPDTEAWLASQAAKGAERFRRFVALCLATPDGSPLFPGGLSAGQDLQLPLPVIDRLMLAAMQVNGLTAAAVETTEKN